MDESAVCSSPTRLKPSRQVGSEARVRFREGRYEAGRNKFAGRVIESRNMYSRGQEENPKAPEQTPTYGRSGRQQSPERYGERQGHHRDLRSWHAHKGITRELERA